MNRRALWQRQGILLRTFFLFGVFLRVMVYLSLALLLLGGLRYVLSGEAFMLVLGAVFMIVIMAVGLVAVLPMNVLAMVSSKHFQLLPGLRFNLLCFCFAYCFLFSFLPAFLLDAGFWVVMLMVSLALLAMYLFTYLSSVISGIVPLILIYSVQPLVGLLESMPVSAILVILVITWSLFYLALDRLKNPNTAFSFGRFTHGIKTPHPASSIGGLLPWLAFKPRDLIGSFSWGRSNSRAGILVQYLLISLAGVLALLIMRYLLGIGSEDQEYFRSFWMLALMLTFAFHMQIAGNLIVSLRRTWLLTSLPAARIHGFVERRYWTEAFISSLFFFVIILAASVWIMKINPAVTLVIGLYLLFSLLSLVNFYWCLGDYCNTGDIHTGFSWQSAIFWTFFVLPFGLYIMTWDDYSIQGHYPLAVFLMLCAGFAYYLRRRSRKLWPDVQFIRVKR